MPQAGPFPKIDRRSAILGGAALASAAAVPAVAAPHTPSPEFVAWQSAWHAFVQACESRDPADDDERCNALSDAHQEAIGALIAKPARTWQDVTDLAIAHWETSYEDGVIDWDAYRGQSSCGIEHAVLEALLKIGGVDTEQPVFEAVLKMGGVNV